MDHDIHTDDCGLGARGAERTFWVPINGGYVRETAEERPGTLGWQVCGGLYHTGSTLEAGRETLLDAIRYEARACIREQERERSAYYY